MIIGLSYLDWFFLSVIFISMMIGAYRGWLPQALSMLGFLAAFVAFVKLGPSIAQWLPLSGPGEALRDNLGALIALIGTLILGHQAVVLHKKLLPAVAPNLLTERWAAFSACFPVFFCCWRLLRSSICLSGETHLGGKTRSKPRSPTSSCKA